MAKNICFKIQPSNPQNNSTFDKEDGKLSEAIYTIFPLETEDAVLSWGEADISLSYRYDIATMIDDLIEMLFTLHDQKAGEWRVAWPSNSFAATWTFEWSGDDLKIKATWREEFQADDYLKAHDTITVGKSFFLEEWRAVIVVLIDNLTECGYSINNLSDMDRLIASGALI
jgi:hypothetical protein